MAQIEVPDDLIAQAQAAFPLQMPEAAPPPAQPPADGSVIQMPDPMRVSEEDQLKANGQEVQQPADLTVQDMVGATDPFGIAMENTNAQLEQELNASSKAANDAEGAVGQTLDAVNRVGLGIGQSVIETGQFIGSLIGNPNIGLGGAVDALERDQKELDRRSGINAFLGGTAQFVTGLVGVGKVMDAVKLGRELNAAGGLLKVGVETAKGAAAAAVVMDPHTARLNDLIMQYPALRNPVSAYLQSDPTDSDAEARFKNALEGAGMDLVVAGIFGAAVRVFRAGKAVEAGGSTEPLTQAQAELDRLVQEAKSPGSSVMPPMDPTKGYTVGGTPSQVIPAKPNLINQATAGPTEQSIIERAQGLGPQADPEAAAIAREVSNSQTPQLPAKANLLTQEVMEGGASGKPVGPATAGVPTPAPRTSPLEDAIIDTAKSNGQTLKRQPGAVDVGRTLGTATKIETNGIGYAIVPSSSMGDIGKAHGIDTSRWLAAANKKTGEIFISDAVLKLPPKRQGEIIAHETGHVLERQFVKALTGVEGDFKALSKEMRDQMVAVSRALRPDHWDEFDRHTAAAKAGSKESAKRAKAKGEYVNHPAELFADNFALWKTQPDQFRQAAPSLAKLFDEQFAPWIDHDFSAHLGDVSDATKGVEALTASPAKAAKGVYQSKDKALRTVEQYEPQAVVTPDAAAEVARVAANDAAAIAQHGNMAKAEAAGYRFGKANLPYQKLNTSEDVTALLAQTAARFKATLDEMKDGDVLSDARTAAAVKQRVELFNEDPSIVMGQLQAAGRNANGMVANMEAAFTIANSAANDLDQLVKNNRLGNYAEFGGDANAAEAALAPRLALYIEALGSAQAMRSALGRGMRRLRGDFILDEATIAMVRKLRPEDVTRLVDMAGGDKRMLAKAATKGLWDRFVRGSGSLFANNLLWNWTSHVRNLLGNTFMLATTPAMRAVGSFGLREGGQTVRVQAMREYRYMLSSMHDAAHMAAKAYQRGDSSLDPFGNEYFREAEGGQTRKGAAGAVADVIGLKPINTVGDAFGNLGRAFVFLTGQPTRVLGMSDEFFKQTSYRGSVLAEVSIKADELGLTGVDFTDYLKSELERAFDANGRATNQAALYDAEVKTFSQPLLPGTFGKTISTAVNAHPVSRFVLPFVRTPANLFRYSVKLTPILNTFQKEYREMLRGDHGPKRQADAYGQMALGGLLAGVGVNMALSGMITGGGPSDPEKLATLTATGWKPYAIMAGKDEEGRTIYVPFNNLDPVGQTLSIIADTAQIMNMGGMSDVENDKLVLPTMIAIAKNLANRTYLRSLNDAFDAVANPDASMANYAGGVASGMVPFSSLLRSTNPDPYMREARGILDKVMAGIPGFSDKLPPRRDYAGEPILRTSGLVFKDASADIADAEQQRMLVNYGVGITPLNAVQKGGVDLRSFALQTTGGPAFDRFQDIISHPKGFELSLKQALGKLIQTEGYARMSDGGAGNVPGTKMHALQAIVRQYRDAGYQQLLAENPDLRTETAVQMQATREAVRTGAPVGVAGQLKRANAAFGIQTQ